MTSCVSIYHEIVECGLSLTISYPFVHGENEKSKMDRKLESNRAVGIDKIAV